MSKAKFKVGQVVSYKLTTSTKRARKGGTITGVETMYELKDENKRTELIANLSKLGYKNAAENIANEVLNLVD